MDSVIPYATWPEHSLPVLHHKSPECQRTVVVYLGSDAGKKGYAGTDRLSMSGQPAMLAFLASMQSEEQQAPDASCHSRRRLPGKRQLLRQVATNICHRL